MTTLSHRNLQGQVITASQVSGHQQPQIALKLFPLNSQGVTKPDTDTRLSKQHMSKCTCKYLQRSVKFYELWN